MRCRYNHGGDCCNSGAAQYMCKCKMPCVYIVPMTNADCIRAMSDKELARFLASKIVDAENLRMMSAGFTPSATEIEFLQQSIYGVWMNYLEQPAEDDQ